MPTLPDTTTAFASSATEAQFKTFLSSQRSFLAGLLGTDGTAVTARATLGVNDGVTSVNGNTGAITAAQIAAAATAGYGYTPANTSHTHPTYLGTDIGYNAVGSLCLCSSDYSPAVAPGATCAGSLLRPAGWSHTGENSSNPGSGYETLGSALSGTWRCLGSMGGVTGYTRCITLWQRIS